MNKEYQPIPGFEKYGIAIDGEVKHLRTGHIKTPVLNKKGGYYIVNLYDATGKLCRPLVHRLVALTYLPNPSNLPQVNHKDENKLNNHVENLEWCTEQYNLNYGTRLARIAQSNTGKTRASGGHSSTQNKPVIQIDKNNNCIVNCFYGLSEASIQTGTNVACICECCNGHQKTAGGYLWKYIYDRKLKDGTTIPGAITLGIISEKEVLDIL